MFTSISGGVGNLPCFPTFFLGSVIQLRQWYAAFRLMCGGLLFVKKPGIRCLSGKTPDSCLQPQCGPQ